MNSHEKAYEVTCHLNITERGKKSIREKKEEMFNTVKNTVKCVKCNTQIINKIIT